MISERLDPAAKPAKVKVAPQIKAYIIKKRQQLKQELEQDAIEKRLKREQEAKRKQDAMTLDQLEKQLNQLERTLICLKNEKSALFDQLKTNMRVLNEQVKQKEGEINAARLQQNEQNRQQQQQQQHQQQPPQPMQQQQQPPQPIQQQQHQHQVPQIQPQPQLLQPQPQQPQPPHQHQPAPQPPPPHQPQVTSNGAHQTSNPNQDNHIRDKPYDLQNQQPHLYLQQQNNHHEQDTLPANSHPPHQPQATHIQRPNTMFNSAAAFSQLLNAHSFPRQSPYLTHLPQGTRSSNPYGPMSPYPSLGHHPPPSLISGHGIPTSLPHVQQTSPMLRPAMDHPLPPMKRPISATNLANDTISPNKKIHTQPPSQNPPPPHQLPSTLSNPYLAYPGLPPGLGSAGGGGGSMPANLFGQNLTRTPPPPNITSLINSAAFSHLLNAHNFPRQSPYLTHIPQPNRASNPYGPMSPYPPLGHHPPASLISGHGIPTSLPHVPQTNPMIRPSPPPLSNQGQSVNSGPPKMPLSLPITSSGPPGPMDFNAYLATSTAHQMQQQARAAAAAAALGITGYGSPYFNSNSPIGPPSQF